MPVKVDNVRGVGWLDTRYLRLDCSNDPLTGNLDVGANNLTVDTDTLFVDATNDRVFIGYAGYTPVGVGGLGTEGLTISDEDGNHSDLTLEVAGASSAHNSILAYTGTLASPTATGNTQILGGFEFYGYDGTNVQGAARMLATVEDTVTAGNPIPARLSFTTAEVERLRLSADGKINLYANDLDDYIQIATTGNVPEITTVGACDLMLNASSGEITSTANFTTTGDIDVSNIDAGNIVTAGTITVNGEGIVVFRSYGWTVDANTYIALVGADHMEIGAGGYAAIDIDMPNNLITFNNVNLSCPALATFGNLDVDTLNFNGNVISDSGGTISLGLTNLITTGNITIDSDVYGTWWGDGQNVSAIYDGSNLIIDPDTSLGGGSTVTTNMLKIDGGLWVRRKGIQFYYGGSGDTDTIYKDSTNTLKLNSRWAVGSGTLNALPYTFVADMNTGLFNPAADRLQFVTEGIYGLEINADQDVLIPNNLIMGNDGLIAVDVNSGLTASTTQSQGQGALTAQVNEISTVANDGDTVTLPSAVTGIEIEIINNGAKTLQIFPASGDSLGLGVDTAEELEANERVEFVAYDTTNWAKKSSTEIIHAEIHDEDNTDAFVINDFPDFHSYHTNGLVAGDLADWTFDAGGAGTSHAIDSIADGVDSGNDIEVTTGDNHLLEDGDIVSQTNLTNPAYVGIFVVKDIISSTQYEVAAVYTATGTGTMDQAATLEADAVAAGVYDFAYYMSGTPVSPNETFDFQLYKEATAVTGSKVRRKFGAGGDFGSMSGGGVVSVANGEKISFALSNEDSAANLTIRNLTIVLVRL